MIKATYGHDHNLALGHLPLPLPEQAALDGDPSSWWAIPAGQSVPTLTVTFARPVSFDRVLTMERLNEGQHIEEYAVDAWIAGAWKELAHGRAIGHKKIDRFTPVVSTRARLRILAATGSAGIREFQVFSGAAASGKH